MVNFSYLTFFFLTGSSTATAYLTPAVLARRNLTVAVNITVEKILFSKTSGSLKAIGVQLTTSPTAPSYRVKARKEIVLSGGVIGSAQTLLLSGVGPKAELEQVGIECVQDLPSVGKHLADVSIDLSVYLRLVLIPKLLAHLRRSFHIPGKTRLYPGLPE